MIYTIGHSTRELGEFLDLLAAHRVTQVVDVRRCPAPRRRPHFARDALAAALEAVGVAYHPEPELGGRRTARRDSTNTAWRSASFRGYADYMETSGFEEALTRLRELARARPTAVLCAEAVPWRCTPPADRRRGGCSGGGREPHPRRRAAGSASAVGARPGASGRAAELSRGPARPDGPVLAGLLHSRRPSPGSGGYLPTDRRAWG